ncbi:hypothetical protein FRC04_002959 [Tulasnella sp. 424]|nr:hypothetical protein FRC04_002959 [Tulasnella sp. 424]
MSSPLNFPDSDDAPMQNDGDAQQTPTRHSGGQRRQLFHTPSVAGGTPATGIVARRALAGTPGVRTPVRRAQNVAAAASSSPLNFPGSSSPGSRIGTAPQPNFDESDDAPMSDGARSGRPLFHPSTPLSTPRRNRRGDVHPSQFVPSSARRRNVQAQHPPSALGSEPPAPSSAAVLSVITPSEGPDTTRVLWGTAVNVHDTRDAWIDFVKNFKVKYRREYDRKNNVTLRPLLDPNEGERKIYIDYLNKMRSTDQTTLNLDVTNLKAYPGTKNTLYPTLIKYPQEVIPIMDVALRDAIQDLLEEEGDVSQAEWGWAEEAPFRVRPFGGQDAINMRELNPSDTDRLISIKGLVIRATPIIPDMKLGFFRCLNCSHTVQVEIDRGRIAEPERCPRDVCNAVGTMNLIHNRSEFADRQIIRLQETPDAVPDGQTPHTVSIAAYDELVDYVKPGDRVTITGIYRSIPVRVNPRQRTIRALFKTYVDVVHIKHGDERRMGYDQGTRTDSASHPASLGVGGEADDSEHNRNPLLATPGIMEDDPSRTRQEALEEELARISQRPDIYDFLSRSVAPSIWEMEDVKKGILLQMFGGTNKSVAKGGGGGGPRYRGDINVLLVGDPGTSKSQILQYVHKISPRGVYTSGKGSSAVGLTAYITRDPDSKQLVLESGALVLSDGGTCCIDEFDKMSDATRSVLHEVMEQQTVSIAKAGIITTLNARASILAAANPVGSRYNVNWPITRNIDLPPTLISRFDLLYLVLDKIDENLDRKLAEHLVSMYLEDRPQTVGRDILEPEKLTAYITYARTKIHPQISQEAANELVACYVDLRNMGEDARTQTRRITATPRQLESLIRLSEAHARMRFSDEVRLEDVQEANRLMREALRMSATDPNTGLIDLDLINTGAGQQERRLRGDLKREILTLLEATSTSGGRGGIRWAEAAKQLQNQSSVRVDANEFTEAVKALESEGLVKIVGERDKRVIRKIINE